MGILSDFNIDYMVKKRSRFIHMQCVVNYKHCDVIEIEINGSIFVLNELYSLDNNIISVCYAKHCTPFSPLIGKANHFSSVKAIDFSSVEATDSSGENFGTLGIIKATVAVLLSLTVITLALFLCCHCAKSSKLDILRA